MEEFVSLFSNAISEIVFTADPNGKIDYYNQSWDEYIGCAQNASIEEKGRFWKELMRPDDLLKSQELWIKAIKSGQPCEMEYQFKDKKNNGQYRWFLGRAAPVRAQDGSILKWIATCTDIDEYKKSERHLLNFASIVNSTGDAIISKNLDGLITSWNPSAEEMYGYTSTETIGQHISMVVPKERMEELEEILKKIQHSERIDHLETIRIHKNGSVVYVSMSVSPIIQNGEIIGVSTIARNITEQKNALERISFHITHDPLTNLLNRKGLEIQLKEAMSELEHKGGQLGLLILDLDRFKNVNDTQGHSTGDILLIEIAQNLSNLIKPKDMIARLGGDEFVIAIKDLNSLEDLTKKAQEIIHSMQRPFAIGKKFLHITPSIGIAIYSNKNANSKLDLHGLLRNADTALTRAKENGRNNYQIFNNKMLDVASKKFILENELHGALARNEFVIHYQPIIDVNTKMIVSAEALVRWQHPRLGLITPNKFIHLAEEIRTIIKIDAWVLGQACKQLKQWQKLEMPNFKIAVNISALAFGRQDLCQTIISVLKEVDLDPKYLELEITESLTMHNYEHTMHTLRELVSMGVGITIDDFGTGYSSLSYLKHFPIDVIKIDKSFVLNCTNNTQDANIMKAITALATNLEMEVIAEGIETKEQFEFVQSLDCDRAQGFLIQKPLTAKAFQAWLETRQSVVQTEISIA